MGENKPFRVKIAPQNLGLFLFNYRKEITIHMGFNLTQRVLLLSPFYWIFILSDAVGGWKWNFLHMGSP